MKFILRNGVDISLFLLNINSFEAIFVGFQELYIWKFLSQKFLYLLKSLCNLTNKFANKWYHNSRKHGLL